MHPVIAQRRAALHALDRFTTLTLAYVLDELRDCERRMLAKSDNDPDGDWDDRDPLDLLNDHPWDWKFGAHKTATQWKNRMRDRQWTKEQITKTIA